MSDPRAVEQIRRWREDPVAFVREAFGAEPDPWQAEALRAFPTHPKQAWLASKGVGKSTMMAWLSWNFLVTRPHAQLAAVSISAENLRDGLWKEMAHWRRKCPILDSQFEQRIERIVQKNSPETWFMSARTWPRNADTQAQADTLAGLHADYLMFLIDEAGSMPPAVLVAAEAGLATGKDNHILVSGNPTDTDGLLYRAAVTNRASWSVTEINGDPDNPNRSPRVSIEWARQTIKDWGGREAPYVMVNVLGQFPKTAFTKLLGPEDVRRARARNPKLEEYEFAPRILGVDVAFQGDDRTVIYPRQGCVAHLPIVIRDGRPSTIAAAVATKWREWDADAAFVDNTGGYGAGVVDALRGLGFNATPVGFAEKALDGRYANRRSEMLYKLAEWVKESGAITGSGDVEDLVGELCSLEYESYRDRLQVVPKDDIKAVLGRSPDMADGLALTFAAPVTSKVRTLNDAEALLERVSGGGYGSQEYDFFERAEGEP